MIILGIETSCDETAAAVLQQIDGRIQILSNVVASSASLQAKYGGIIPEQAARQQLESIIPVIEEALQQSGVEPLKLDAIAVTQGPGLIGSLLVGVETAKTLALIWNKPLIPINHLIGHFYANWIVRGDSERGARHLVPSSEAIAESRTSNGAASWQDPEQSIPTFPCIGLLVSGGHTDLVLFRNHGEFEYLGGTRDDAAGECFDKCARLLNLPYPGGPQISKLAASGNPKAFKLPRPMIDSDDFDFSYSGLKTAVANLVKELRTRNYELGGNSLSSSDLDPSSLADLSASIEQAIIDPLIKKTVAAAQKHKVDQIIVAGGVAASQKLSSEIKLKCQELGIKLFIPPPYLCTDNASMIASAAFFTSLKVNPLELQANPNLSLAY